MSSVRMHGGSPFRTAVVHGGPGAGGEMAPVARYLAHRRGVLEPIQTALSLEGQVEELRGVLQSYGDSPMVLIGFSWGAWLSFMLTARHPALVRKLILVGSGPFEDSYAAELHETRMGRLSRRERKAFAAAVRALEDPETEDRNAYLAQLGALAGKADAYDPVASRPREAERIGPRADIFLGVWREAARLRRSGGLLALGQKIKCPVVAIHGDYDPHPAEGVRKPLEGVLPSFRFVLLERCGHKPWVERQAGDTFLSLLEKEVQRALS